MNKGKKLKWVMGTALLIGAVLALSFWHHVSRPSGKIGFLMDTRVRLVIYDKGNQEKKLEGAFAILRKIDSMMNVHQEDSELSHLNREGKRKVSPELYQVIERGLYFSEQTNGCFDITVRPLTEIWDFKQEQIPSDDAVSAALKKVDYRNVILSEDNEIQLMNGAMLDLGGIAKGYAADCVWEYLKEQDVRNALIDIGGNIKALGSGPEGNGFQIGLQDPQGQQGSYFALLAVADKSVVSSGIYERNFIKDGQLYHHIIDVSNGRPLQNGMVASSVIAESAMDADALSTAVMAMGAEKGIQLAETLPGVECIIVDENNRLFLTKALKEMLNITDATYDIAE